MHPTDEPAGGRPKDMAALRFPIWIGMAPIVTALNYSGGALAREDRRMAAHGWTARKGRLGAAVSTHRQRPRGPTDGPHLILPRLSAEQLFFMVRENR